MEYKDIFKKAQRNKISILIYMASVCVFAMGFLVRVEGFKSGDILFLYDNARDLLYIHKIVDLKDLILIGPSSGGLEGYFHGVLWYYILALPYFLGKGSPYVMSLFMAILSFASILVSFYLLRRVMNIWAGIFIALFFSFSLFSIETSRYIWNPFPIVWIMPFYFFFLYGFVKNKIYALPALAFLTSLVIHFEAIYGITLLPILIIIGIHELIKIYKEKKGERIYSFLLSILLFFIPMIPSVLFDIKHNFLISNSIMNTINSGGSNLSHDPKIPMLAPIERLEHRFLDLIKYTFGSLTQIPVLNLVYAFVFIFGVCVFLRNKKWENKYLISLSLFVLLMPFLFFINLKYAVWNYYWIGVAPFFACLVAFLIGNLANKYGNRIHPWLLALFFITIIFSFPKLELEKINTGYTAPGYNNLNTQLKIVNKILEDSKGSKYSVYVFTPPVYDYVYRYLFNWKNRTEGYVLPDDNKQKIMYVILEPSSSDPDGSYFKENFLKTKQKPIEEYAFPGGVRLQKIITLPDEPPADSNFLPKL